jgi:hypothetical protein
MFGRVALMRQHRIYNPPRNIRTAGNIRALGPHSTHGQQTQQHHRTSSNTHQSLLLPCLSGMMIRSRV